MVSTDGLGVSLGGYSRGNTVGNVGTTVGRVPAIEIGKGPVAGVSGYKTVQLDGPGTEFDIDDEMVDNGTDVDPLEGVGLPTLIDTEGTLLFGNSPPVNEI